MTSNVYEMKQLLLHYRSENMEYMLPGLLFLDYLNYRSPDSSIIAGGAVRDGVLGVPIKDVDIWVSTKSFKDISQVLGMLREQFPQAERQWTTVGAYAGGGDRKMGGIDGIAKFKYGGMTIDLIFVPERADDHGQSIVETFDFGLCMAVVDDHGTWVHTLFREDAEKHTLTFHASDRALAGMKRVTQNHLPRLRAKYPDYKVQGFTGIFEKYND